MGLFTVLGKPKGLKFRKREGKGVWGLTKGEMEL